MDRIIFLFLWRNNQNPTQAASFGLLYHTQFQTRTSNDTSVNELLFLCRGRYQHHTKKQEFKIMFPAGFKPAIPKIERSQGYLPEDIKILLRLKTVL